MTQFILITGGARSGKSSYAEQLAKQVSDDVLYVATAQAWDDDMRARIAKHQDDRPDYWQTLETPLDVGAVLAARGTLPDVVLIDCMTLLTSNAMLALPEPWEDAQTRADAEVAAIKAAHGASKTTFIVVTNEVGLGIVPENKMARVYRDVLGRVNQSLASYADQVILLVSGLPLVVKGE